MDLPGQVWADLLVAVRGGGQREVVDGQRLEAERAVRPGPVERRAEARLERVYLGAGRLGSVCFGLDLGLGSSLGSSLG